ncbi:hypothetical protein M407DRAFT_242328 [Tulasnella calospora MUT 4182]|uniref:Uncharacterized protein n=1 Tax=Tulasnella calospora MUT 4182 TaxID=1051891 RepID=A0A0C3QFF6_9AGAM|nr:hypothetical protein M407DRAFT_242328 [Tulasnella calospora MUT 4182]
MSLEAQILSDQATLRSAYAEFAAYRFHEDPEFLSGLASILGSADEAAQLSAEERAEKVGRAKAFYFSRLKGVEVTWDGYLRYSQPQETNSGVSNVTSTVEATDPPLDTRTDPALEEQRPLSFQQLSEMIATGNLTDVPFNRLIPEAISDQKPSDPATPARRKPWENVDADKMADKMAARLPDEIANGMADEGADRTADEMAKRVAQIAYRMADELPDRMADEDEMAGKMAR